MLEVEGRIFANGLGDRGSIPARVRPKTQKIVLDVSLHNTQHYKVRIKGKVEQSKERSSNGKQRLRVALDNGHHLIYIYIYIYKASYVSSYTEELWYNETVCLWMAIIYAPLYGLSTLAKEFSAVTRIM